jgi:hypothetical protein
MFFSSICVFYGIRSLIPAIFDHLNYYTHASQDCVETPARLLFLPLPEKLTEPHQLRAGNGGRGSGLGSGYFDHGGFP